MTPPTSIGPDAAASAIIGVIAAVFLCFIVVGVIHSFQTKNEQRLLSTIAIPEGLWIGAGISPDGRLAVAMARNFEAVPPAYRVGLLTFLSLSTIALLFVGAARVWESGGWAAFTGFFLVFLGGVALPSSVTEIAMLGMFGIAMGFFMADMAPARSMWGGR